LIGQALEAVVSKQGPGVLSRYTLGQILHWYYLGVKRERKEMALLLNVVAVGAQGSAKGIEATLKEIGAS